MPVRPAAPSRTLSVLTAYAGGPDLLRLAAESLAGQVLPDGWSLQWVVALDRTDDLPDLPLPAVVVRTHGRAAGVSAARTLAAVASDGELLHVLDADDELPPGALSALVTALVDEPQAGWAAGAQWDVVDVRGDVLERRTAALPAGLVKSGEVGAFRRLHGRCPFPPAQLAVRADALWAAGGWPALAIEEDTALLLALDAAAPGVLVEGTRLRSRRHAAQGTGDLPGLAASFAAAERYLQRRGLA